MGRKRDSYFLITAWMFLIVVIIGFSKGFFFRPIYKETSIPSYLVIHGALMVIWYVAYVYQSHLVYKGNIINHRRFGTF
ncbi:hypothetical protein [Aegicerativicinus sediminis]|uniref:hypothetical protein n=1 Tax=Aegicerativicinus sediminis TaxID=2893202 RepID=UPI001E4CD663|nr:hypothetical protein [Aegicerativicinus sediminis]